MEIDPFARPTMSTPTSEAQSILDLMRAAADADPEPPPKTASEILAAWRHRVASAIVLQGQPPDLAEVSDIPFGRAGEPIGLRLYRPAAGVLPVLLYLHGGGFVCGSIGSHDVPLRTLAQETGWAVAAVDYRLAPEHPYPAGLEDCYAALSHIAGAADALALDAARIVVGGDSAGGLLAAATSLMARDRGGPALAGMILLYPNTDLRDDSGYPSKTEHDGKIFSLVDFRRMMGLYLPGVDRRHPYVSPVLADDLRGLPRSLTVVCECDPLHDEGMLWADRLRDAGTAAETVRLDGMVHGLLSFLPLAPVAGRRILESVRAFLGPPGQV
jgi:acetyl esterase